MTAIDVTAATGWIAAALGVLAPILVAIINRPTWTAQVRRGVAIAVSVVLAVVAFVVTGGLDDFSLQNLMAVILGVVGLAQTTYALLWKPTGTTVVVENATNPTTTSVQHSEPPSKLDILDGVGRHSLPEERTE